MKYFKIMLIIVFMATFLTGESLRVMSYNLLKFSYDDTDRLDELAIIFNYVQPDVLLCQEIVDATAISNLLNQSLPAGEYSSALFHNGYDTDCAFIYRKDKVNFISAQYIGTDLRDIAEYQAEVYGETVYFYSAHFKASNGTEEAAQRLSEATTLRLRLATHPDGTSFIAVGDWNYYGADEPAYQKMVSSEPDDFGRLFDPLDPTGVWDLNPSQGIWHESYTHRFIHTQSPRTLSFGGGATGGLDDRFDFILVSHNLMSRIEDTFPVGNDGNHYNTSLITGANSVVSAEVAQALHDASDHLPIVADIYFEPVSVASPVLANDFRIVSVYPNPFNSSTTIHYTAENSYPVSISLYDLNGRLVYSQQERHSDCGSNELKLDMPAQASGMYILKIGNNMTYKSQRLVLIK